MDKYLESFCNQQEQENEKFEILRKYAEEYKVPIIKRDSLELIKLLLRLNNCKRILEIGTAIGYSALAFSFVSGDIKIDTIERNEDMYFQAVKNIANFNKESQIKVYYADALEIDLNELSDHYDMIFIDAAKAQYQKFFEKFAPLLSEDGMILTDNIVFHGCVENQEGLSRNLRSMVKKIDMYNNYLKDKEDFVTYFLDSGDGLGVSLKVKK